MPMIKSEKAKLIEEIKEKFQQSEGIILAEFKGLNVEQITRLRGKFRENGVSFKVYKNTFIAKAIEDKDFYEKLKGDLVRTTALASAEEDPVAPAKVIVEFVKENKQLDEKIKMKSGIVEGRYMDKDGVIKLAAIPSKQELLSKIAGSLNAPMSNFVGVMSGLLRQFVGTLDAVRDKIEKENN